MVDPNTIFIDGTHIKASANKKNYQKEQVAKAAKVYSGQLRREIYAQRKETVERVFADAKEKHAMCVIHTTEAWPPSHDGSGLNSLP